MGNVKIKISFHPRDVHRTTTSHLVPKVDHFFEKNPWTLENKLRTWRSGVRTIVKGKKGQYLGSWAMKQKTKDTLFSQTFKVSLFFLIMAQEARYGHFIVWSQEVEDVHFFEKTLEPLKISSGRGEVECVASSEGKMPTSWPLDHE